MGVIMRVTGMGVIVRTCHRVLSTKLFGAHRT
jgi:hypothetical protein